MNKGHKETITIRIVSCAFMVLALAIFKPFGLEVWQWQAYVHLLAIFALGLFSCFLTEVILRFVVRMPRSYDRGVSYMHQHAIGVAAHLPLSSLGDEQSGRWQPVVVEQLSGDIGDYCFPLLCHRTLLAFQVP